jgi:replicative DNA helicase
MLSDLRESGSLEQDSDVVILIHREEHYDKEARPGEADLIVAKHRNGPVATIAVSFQGHYSRFAEMPNKYSTPISSITPQNDN